jgi:hypothetical protein
VEELKMTRSWLGLILVAASIATIVPTTPARGQQPVGPEFAIVPTKPAALNKRFDTNCQDYFVRTTFDGGIVIVAFYYSEKGVVKPSSSALDELSYNIDPTKSSPMAQFLGKRGDDIIWQLNMSQESYNSYQTCLVGIKQAIKE